MVGAARRIVISPEERRRTAYHESGHALLGMLEPGADPVRKVSIIPRGSALGVTFQSPDADRYGLSQTYLRGRIVGALGGRAAEEIVFGDVTTGAASPATLELIDEEVRRLIADCYGRAVETLTGHHEQLDALAHALLAKETLDEAEAYAAAGLHAPDALIHAAAG